jgi:sporulation protein YlmC with PRC-barrel domain
MKISEIYRMDVYSDSGQYLGDVQDVVIDLEKGEISRLLMTPWKSLKGDATGLLKRKSILYKSVKNVGDVVLVSAPSGVREESASKQEINDLSR